MEASEPKWVNPVLNIIGLTHLDSEASIWNILKKKLFLDHIYVSYSITLRRIKFRHRRCLTTVLLNTNLKVTCLHTRLMWFSTDSVRITVTYKLRDVLLIQLKMKYTWLTVYTNSYLNLRQHSWLNVETVLWFYIRIRFS